MTKITRVEVIDENGRSYVNFEDDNDVSVSYQDDGRTLKVFVNKVKPEPQTLFDVIRNLGYSVDCCEEIVDAIEEFEKQKEKEMVKRNLKTSLQELANSDVRPIDDVVKEAKEEYPYKKYTPEETEQSLKTAFREAVKQGVVSSVDKSKDDFDALMEDPPSFLRFELGSTLEDRIYKWYHTCFIQHPEWNGRECIDDLLDIITLFLPGEQSHEGTQNIDTVVAVEAHNELLRKIKSKLRNKKDT